MRGEKDRGTAFRGRADALGHRHAGCVVKSLGRLVEQEQARSREQELLERQQLLLAAGEVVGVAVRAAGEAQALERGVDLGGTVAARRRRPLLVTTAPESLPPRLLPLAER